MHHDLPMCAASRSAAPQSGCSALWQQTKGRRPAQQQPSSRGGGGRQWAGASSGGSSGSVGGGLSARPSLPLRPSQQLHALAQAIAVPGPLFMSEGFDRERLKDLKQVGGAAFGQAFIQFPMREELEAKRTPPLVRCAEGRGWRQ